jgi:hypothetical protein
MKKTLVFLVLLTMLLPSGWMDPQSGAAWQGDTSSAAGRSFSANTASRGVKLAAQEGQAFADAAGFTGQMNLMYPDDINPPETCHVPRLAPLGQGVEMMLGPWVGPNALLALEQPSAWNGEANLAGVTASTNLDVISLNTEELVAA